ncbi:MAG TPA: CheR family methyltransferase [Spirochaetia bacterium]|nr:CheR family methyltransferase [Spirochaetia bacterium]
METSTELSESLFKKIAVLFKESSGINLKDYKKYLVEYRLQKFVGEGKPFKDFHSYYRALKADKTGELRTEFVNSLTTNYTYFFREAVHFRFLKNYLAKHGSTEQYLRFWSAGCSSGEEAYSMAITCLEHGVAQKDIKILATDISLKVLTFAAEGIYHYSKIKGDLSDSTLRKYFIFNPDKKNFQVREEVKQLIAFRYLNLMDPFPFRKRFDIVFLRNVLIYFDTHEKEIILEKIGEELKEGGYLILGLSESLVGIQHRFTQLKYSIYRKDYS